MKLILDISNVAVLCRPGYHDVVWIHTELPSTITDNKTATLKLELLQGTAEQWVRDHLGVTPQLIKAPKGW